MSSTTTLDERRIDRCRLVTVSRRPGPVEYGGAAEAKVSTVLDADGGIGPVHASELDHTTPLALGVDEGLNLGGLTHVRVGGEIARTVTGAVGSQRDGQPDQDRQSNDQAGSGERLRLPAHTTPGGKGSGGKERAYRGLSADTTRPPAPRTRRTTPRTTGYPGLSRRTALIRPARGAAPSLP